jgi:uncharacterized membrane protein (UPF0127 family)
MPDKKYFPWLVVVGLILIFSIAAFFISQGILEKERKGFWGNEIKEIKIGENIFQAEVAASSVKRRQGLSGRKELCENCAMLFLFSERGRHSFWMKEMNFDLDIIWIDKNEIVQMAKNVSRKEEFKAIQPEREADKVLEINAGLADKLGIKVGDKTEF